MSELPITEREARDATGNRLQYMGPEFENEAKADDGVLEVFSDQLPIAEAAPVAEAATTEKKHKHKHETHQQLPDAPKAAEVAKVSMHQAKGDIAAEVRRLKALNKDKQEASMYIGT